MTDRRGPPAHTTYAGSWWELPVQLCNEKLSGLWQIGWWDVGIQQRGSGHASHARAQSCRNSLSPEPTLISVCLRARTVFTV
jgi:hypothetical protein